MVHSPLLASLSILVLLAGCPTGRSEAPAPAGDGPGSSPDAAAAHDRPPADRPRHRGVGWEAGPWEVTSEHFDSLLAVGAERIAQTPFGWQDAADSPELDLITGGRVFWGETDEGLEVTTRLARERGIRTLLKPHVWLRRAEDGAWRGEIAMGSDEDWERWFASYRGFILHYARLAERLGMPTLAVGTELHATVRERPEDWRRIIREVRGVYSGELTYAANWSGEIEDVTFWDALDLVGVQAYFPLSHEPLPTVEELVAGWRPHVERLEALHRETGKPILFTEVGYASREGAAQRPWEWPELGPELPEATAEGLELQARAYEALFRALWDRPWFAGLYLWKWSPYVPADHVARNPLFSPQGKPAEQVLRRWYQGGAEGAPGARPVTSPRADGRGGPGAPGGPSAGG